MIRSTPRLPRRPSAAREGQHQGQQRAQLVFRDFVRQLERLDAKPPKTPRGALR
jgi:hypothetical protein